MGSRADGGGGGLVVDTMATEASAAPAWRHLSFYEHTVVRDAADFVRSPSALRATNEISTVAVGSSSGSGSGGGGGGSGNNASAYVLVGDFSGGIRVLDVDTYAELGTWQAFHGGATSGRVTHLSCDSKGRAVTLGEDESSRFPVLRIWQLNVDRGTSQWTAPTLLAEAKVQHGSRPHPVAALAHTPSLSFISIGLADGSVLLLRDVDEVLKGTAPVTLPRFKVAFQPSAKSNEGTGQEPVTGLGFAEQHPKPSTAVQVNGDAVVRRNRAGSRRQPLRRKVTPNGVTPRAAVEQPPQTVHLFIVTLSRILRYTVIGKGAGSPATVVDDVGCALGCASMIPSHSAQTALAGKMVIAREEAIYVVGVDGREVCLAYEGPKSSIRLSSTQLVIISPPIQASATSESPTVRHHVNQRDRMGRNSKTNVDVAKATVFDLDNKLVAYSATFDGGIREAWAGNNGQLFILGDDGTLTRLDEKSLKAKLDILFRKSLFLLAINVSRSHTARATTVSLETPVEPLLADIFRKYGDHLYAKGDFEGAMNQFVKTVGVTQPSYVIRKFLDAQRINNLVTYLQELHNQGLANSDHTTLLLNCYTKLKDVTSLDRFIKRPLAATADREGDRDQHDGGVDEEDQVENEEELPFDLETAIRVCRQAGYFEHAAYLAKRYGQHDEYMRIQIEDLGDAETALSHVCSLSAEEAESNLVQYGRAMLNKIPDKTTDVLIELCSGVFQPTPVAVGTGVEAARSKSTAAGYLAYLQAGPFAAAAKGTNAGAAPEGASQLESQDKDGYKIGDSKAEEATPANSPPIEEQRKGAYPLPSPRIFFAHFIRHPAQFIRFLETVALARWDQQVDMAESAPRALAAPDAERDNDDDVLRQLGIEPEDGYEDLERKDQKAIWNTLLELYLRSSRREMTRRQEGEGRSLVAAASESMLDEEQRMERRERASRLLEQYQSLPYDITQALVLCSHEKFTQGVVLLYERMGMYEDVLRLHMDAARDDEIMPSLRRYGPSQPHLYPLVLRYFCSSEDVLSRHRRDVQEVLDHIEEVQLMGPLEIVQTLSRTPVASVGLVRDHLIRAIKQQKQDIDADDRLIESYRAETDKKLAEIAQLTDASQPLVFQHSTCTACGGQLDLPSVHFMCRHSFHQRCLHREDLETECPACARSHAVVREIRRNNEQFAKRHDVFLEEVKEADEGFDVVASMFSKGLLGAAQLGGTPTS